MPEGMEAAGEAVGATISWLSTQDAVDRGDMQPSLVTTSPPQPGAFFPDTSSCFSQGLLPSPPSPCLPRFLFPSLSAV